MATHRHMIDFSHIWLNNGAQSWWAQCQSGFVNLFVEDVCHSFIFDTTNFKCLLSLPRSVSQWSEVMEYLLNSEFK